MAEGKFYPEDATLRTPATLESDDMAVMGYDGAEKPLITPYTSIRDAAFSGVSVQTIVWRDTEAAGVSFLGTGPPDDPSEVEILTGLGNPSGILAKSYDIGNWASGSFPFRLDYKNGTDIAFYVEMTGNAAVAVGGTIKFQVTYINTKIGTVIGEPTLITAEAGYPTQYQKIRMITADIPGSAFERGDTLLVTIERLAATTTDYPGAAIILEGGMLYQSNLHGIPETPPLPSSI